MITSGLQDRYNLAIVSLVTFWQEAHIPFPDMANLDDAVSTWLEYIFSEGEPKGLASDGLAGIQFHIPASAGNLRQSWKLLKTWQRIEPPQRVIPLSPILCRAFAAACAKAGKINECAAILLAFDALLRPGELYMLQFSDITFYRERSVVHLRDTKTGQRKGSSEMIVVESVLANRYLRKAFHYSNRKGFLLACGAPRFRTLFRNLVDHFELEGLYAVYSLRRGGATWDFLMHNSMERTLLRGRWS